MKTRKHGLTQSVLLGLLTLYGGHSMRAEESATDRAIDIGSRLELFVDRCLVDKLGNVNFRLHEPRQLPVPKSPLVGAYMTVIKDGDLYRAYYRETDKGRPKKKGIRTLSKWWNHEEVYRYAESRDGCEWTFPELGLHEVRGSSKNNVIIADMQHRIEHNFSPFLDTRTSVDANERFKALAGSGEKAEGEGLFALVSSDGIHWKQKGHTAVIPGSHAPGSGGGFDSQNASFWSEAENLYVCYFRTWWSPFGKLRSIARTTSPDFVNWSKPVEMSPNLPGEHLYTNQTHPYFRAPHIYIALPTRIVPDRGMSTDILLMTTRAGSGEYDRLFTEAFIRPGLDPARWGNRSNYAALNVVPTGQTEMSIYHEHSGHRYVLRTDGFVSARAGAREGELLTKPLRFAGNKLIVNYSTSAAGSLRVEIQKPDGTPNPGFRLDDCPAIIGDAIEQPVRWSGDVNLERLAGEPVRIRFVMTECDLYSFRFSEK
jgi:hypothetical protein